MLTNDVIRTAAATVTPDGATATSVNPVYEDYVIVGVVIFFVALISVILVLVFVRRLREYCCFDSKMDILQTYASVKQDDDSLEEISSDSHDYTLYKNCRLYVADPETDQPDYDCVSVDISLLSSDGEGSINADRQQKRNDADCYVSAMRSQFSWKR